MANFRDFDDGRHFRFYFKTATISLSLSLSVSFSRFLFVALIWILMLRRSLMAWHSVPHLCAVNSKFDGKKTPKSIAIYCVQVWYNLCTYWGVNDAGRRSKDLGSISVKSTAPRPIDPTLSNWLEKRGARCHFERKKSWLVKLHFALCLID